MLTFMPEEDAFWCLVGLAKSMKNVFSLDSKVGLTSDADFYENFCPWTNRKVCFKNEMAILNLIIKIHFPQVFHHLKSLSVPLEWYFYEAFSSFFTEVFSSEVVLRLWDMIILNLSANEND